MWLKRADRPIAPDTVWRWQGACAAGAGRGLSVDRGHLVQTGKWLTAAGHVRGGNGISGIVKRAGSMLFSPEADGKRHGQGRLEGKPLFS